MRNSIIVAGLLAALIPGTAPFSEAFAATSQHEVHFLTDAMMADNSEVMLGKLAVARGGSNGVKNFGQMLVQDHSAHKEKVAALAKKMNVPITDKAMPEAQAEHQKLSKMDGAAFDQEFATFMAKDHQKVIAKFEAEAKSQDDAQIKALATATLPTLRNHLTTAQSLSGKR